MRLLGGFARNFEFKVLDSKALRPTLSQLKRKIFDRYQNMSSFRFIDLCSGSGSIGLEALSRGASEVYFFENNKKHFDTLKKNIHLFNAKYSREFEFEIFMIKQSFTKLNEQSFELSDEQNFFYFDPPFDKPKLYDEIFSVLKNAKGHLVIECDEQKTLNSGIIQEIASKYDWSFIKCYSQGTHALINLLKTE